MSLPTRKIGQVAVSALGYGCMGIAAFYGKPLPDEDRLKVRVLLCQGPADCLELTRSRDAWTRSSTRYTRPAVRSGTRQTCMLTQRILLESGTYETLPQDCSIYAWCLPCQPFILPRRTPSAHFPPHAQVETNREALRYLPRNQVRHPLWCSWKGLAWRPRLRPTVVRALSQAARRRPD